MEKRSVKKELYKERYEFLNFMEFFRFYFDFSGIFLDLIPLKKGKNSGDRGIMAHLNRAISAVESSFSESDGP